MERMEYEPKLEHRYEQIQSEPLPAEPAPRRPKATQWYQDFKVVALSIFILEMLGRPGRRGRGRHHRARHHRGRILEG